MNEGMRAICASVRPGATQAWDEGGDGRHRPHKECRKCGTSLYCDRSRQLGLCRVCQPAACPNCGQLPKRRMIRGVCERCYSAAYRAEEHARKIAARTYKANNYLERCARTKSAATEATEDRENGK